MTRNYAGHMVGNNTTATHHEDLLFTITAGQFLTRFECHGIMNTPAVGGNFGTGTTFSHVQVAGLQYGAAGYTPVAMNGTTVGATYVTWGDITPGTDRQLVLAGTSPVAMVFDDARQLNISWHGLFYVAATSDFYLCTSNNGSSTVSFGVNYQWFAEWAS